MVNENYLFSILRPPPTKAAFIFDFRKWNHETYSDSS